MGGVVDFIIEEGQVAPACAHHCFLPPIPVPLSIFPPTTSKKPYSVAWKRD